jgi:hypothetical protein
MEAKRDREKKSSERTLAIFFGDPQTSRAECIGNYRRFLPRFAALEAIKISVRHSPWDWAPERALACFTDAKVRMQSESGAVLREAPQSSGSAAVFGKRRSLRGAPQSSGERRNLQGSVAIFGERRSLREAPQSSGSVAVFGERVMDLKKPASEVRHKFRSAASDARSAV